jgi:hypothetical protein
VPSASAPNGERWRKWSRTSALSMAATKMQPDNKIQEVLADRRGEPRGADPELAEWALSVGLELPAEAFELTVDPIDPG